MEAIENTDEQFEPRFQIELSKAGELPEDRYFFDPNKPSRAPRTTRSVGIRTPRVSFGPVYIFRCNVCGKTFRKKTYDASLNPHKGKSGFCVTARTGYMSRRNTDGDPISRCGLGFRLREASMN